MSAHAKVRCVVDGDVVVSLRSIVMDDEEMVYRFTCPKCGTRNELEMTARIRAVLRHEGVPTVDEVVASGSAVLNDDAAVENVLRAWS
jgi:predicted NBD/HSP70 family sugar kinase